jgi:hypothetical protein
MPTDKERADMLLTLCEELFVRACALQALLEESGLANWLGRLDKTIDSEQATQMRAEFHETYEWCLQQADQNALGKFLKNAKTGGKIQ